MKKAGLLAFILILMLPNTFTALASGEFQNVQALFQHWEENGYPDYVSSVYSTDGSEKLTILLLDREKEDVVRNMLIDESGVSFGTGSISQETLLKVHEEILNEYILKDPMVYAAGIGWTSIDGELTGFGESKRESRVIVYVDKNYMDEYKNEFRERYGDVVYVDEGSPAEAVEEGEKKDVTNVESLKKLNLLFVILPVALIMTLAGVYSTPMNKKS
ncbi:MAG TPA: hypothetical protein VLM88_00235 [Proteiniclasticum sp.]|nr:hypothetical protein [Proteiniclasticum sp.]